MSDDLSLYWSLFQGEFPDDWKSDPDFLQYLSELGAYSAEKLQLEPEHLREERRCVLNSTQKLAFNNYKTFIQTAECTREVFKDFVLVEQHVSQLLEKIPGFTSACKQFTKDSQDVNTQRKLNTLALSRHTHLLEVLEIPQVMETCVRNGYYEEALDLSAHVRRMEKKHGNIPIIRAIASDVEGSIDLMLNQLLQQLRGSIQLPACLRVVGFLRRMEVFSNMELRLKFLQARDCWLQSVLSAIPVEDPYQHISKTIEASRVHLFDIVTQYRAIFPDDDTLLASYHGNSGGNIVEGALFYSWVNQKVWQFLQELEKDLQRGVGGRMDSILSQCMYFGLSFSRIGTDFRSLVAPVFLRVITRNFRQSLRNAKHSFHESMKRFTLVAPIKGLSSSLPPPPSISTHSLTPPHTLLNYPPLATLTNTLIQAFNDLRQCAPLALGPEVSQELRRLLESVVHDVGEYQKVEHASFSTKETDAFTQLCRVVVQDFLPFVKKCFDALFTESSVEQLALTTPYALRHCNKNKEGEAVFHSMRHTLDLNMEIDVKSIGGTLKSFAPMVFEDMEKSTLSSLNLDIESLLQNQTVLVSGQESVPSGEVTALAATLGGGSGTGKEVVVGVGSNDSTVHAGSKVADLLVDGDKQPDVVREKDDGTATGTLETIGENGLDDSREAVPGHEEQRTSESS